MFEHICYSFLYLRSTNLFIGLLLCCSLKFSKICARIATSDFTEGRKPGLAKRPVKSFIYAM